MIEWVENDREERDERIKALYQDGYTYTEIAKISGYTRGQVKTAIDRMHRWKELERMPLDWKTRFQTRESRVRSNDR